MDGSYAYRGTVPTRGAREPEFTGAAQTVSRCRMVDDVPFWPLRDTARGPTQQQTSRTVLRSTIPSQPTKNNARNVPVTRYAPTGLASAVHCTVVEFSSRGWKHTLSPM